jgi:hypothetical protein
MQAMPTYLRRDEPGGRRGEVAKVWMAVQWTMPFLRSSDQGEEASTFPPTSSMCALLTFHDLGRTMPASKIL